MLKTEELEQLLDYVDLTQAIAEGECARCRHHSNAEHTSCPSCSIGVVREHLQKAHNALMQLASL